MAAPLALGALLVLLRSKRALSAADRLRARRLLVCAMGGGEPQPLTRDMAAQAVHALLDELVAMGIPAEGDLGGRRSIMDDLSAYVAMACGCKVYWTSGDGRRRAVYFGRDPNPEVAAYIHDVCFGAVRRAVAEYRFTDAYRRKRLARTRNELVRAFVEAMVARLGNQLLTMRFGVPPETRQEMILRAADELTRREGHLSTARDIKRAPQRSDLRDARAAGNAAGRAVQINNGMTGQQTAGLLGETR